MKKIEKYKRFDMNQKISFGPRKPILHHKIKKKLEVIIYKNNKAFFVLPS